MSRCPTHGERLVHVETCEDVTYEYGHEIAVVVSVRACPVAACPVRSVR